MSELEFGVHLELEFAMMLDLHLFMVAISAPCMYHIWLHIQHGNS